MSPLTHKKYNIRTYVLIARDSRRVCTVGARTRRARYKIIYTSQLYPSFAASYLWKPTRFVDTLLQRKHGNPLIYRTCLIRRISHSTYCSEDLLSSAVMISSTLLISVFFIQLALYLINSIGAKTINEILWQLYIRLPFGTSKDIKEQARLRRDVVRLKREMAAVSAQDEFSRWAKIRRQHDKALAEYDKTGMESVTTCEISC